jgi:hypothetical protein
MIEETATLLAEIERLEEEVKLVHDEVMLHGLVQTLYGYVMMTFAHVDRASALWTGSGSTKGQTVRMVGFLDRYVSSNHEANSVAVQVWRHKLIHTARPRPLTDRVTGKTYYWLLHWWIHLPREQHNTLTDSAGRRILNLGLVYLIEDLRVGIQKYLEELATCPDLRKNFDTVGLNFGSYAFLQI